MGGNDLRIARAVSWGTIADNTDIRIGFQLRRRCGWRYGRSGQIRRTPLLFTEVDGDLVIVASATGRPKHPAWYHNLRANPHVKIYAPGGRSGDYIARTTEGQERERLWAAARELYAGFDVYVERVAGAREIPVVALSRV